ncbi:GntR family transcriptional regulator [Streptomyces sp. TRM S81-3]|uniref:GntR family transcriptional regulator n=2 Tax=Streptomyces griseicoloratus TaxID=2752516 RepID=A0A926L2K3_9ACTN|nr:GntR family transcriptional regulator [Streptomyces griseicoloratus]
MIARGEYRPDAPFTTRREICERFEVSMGTAVRVLNELVQEGVLVRRRGRGTFVAEAAMRTGVAMGPGRSPALRGAARLPQRALAEAVRPDGRMRPRGNGSAHGSWARGSAFGEWWSSGESSDSSPNPCPSPATSSAL